MIRRFDHVGLSLRRMWRRKSTLVPVLLTIIVVTAIVAVSLSAVGGWLARSREECNSSAMRRVKVTALSSSQPLVAADLKRLQGPGYRCVPSLSAIVYVCGVDDRVAPMLCSSFVDDDPTLADAPVLEGVVRAEGATAVLAPNVLQRLGLPTRGMVGKHLNMRVVRVGQDRGEQWYTFACRMGAIVGDLGMEGLRIDLTSVAGILRYQQGHDGVEALGAPVHTATDDITPVVAITGGPLGKTRETPEAVLGRLGEIHAINVFMDDASRILDFSKDLEATGKYRCESRYYEYGKRTAFLLASGKVAIPFSVALLAAAFWTAFITLAEQVRRERSLICHWRSVGASAREIFAVYFLQGCVIAFLGAWVGLLAAVLIINGPGDELATVLGVEGLFGKVPGWQTVVGVTILGMLSALVPCIRAARVDLDEGLRDSGVMA